MKDLNQTQTPEKNISAGERCLKIFAPIHNHTNPLWYIVAPFFVPIYKKDSMIKDYLNFDSALLAETGLSKRALILDMAYSMAAFGATPGDYLDFCFYKHNNLGRSRFMTQVNRFGLYRQLNNLSQQDVFNDKARSAQLFKKWYKRQWILLKSEEDIQGCVQFLQQRGEIILKPLKGARGIGVHKLCFEGTPNPAEYFKKILTDSDWILEELINQHPDMAIIHSSSVNTVRVHTLRSKKGKVRIVYPYLRAGAGNSITDNISSGGVCAKVDAETGRVFGEIYPPSPLGSLTHPDTGYPIIGMQLPCWEEAKAMAQEIAQVRPDFGYIGWDFAYTNHGWVLVEANCRPGCPAWQEIDCVGILREFQELIRWAQEN